MDLTRAPYIPQIPNHSEKHEVAGRSLAATPTGLTC